MTDHQTAIAELRAHAGVEEVLLVGRDGLLVHRSGEGELDTDTVAAMIPGLSTACASLADAAGAGGFSTAVLEWDRRVCVVASVSEELLLVVLIRSGVGFAPLLRSMRTQRSVLAAAFG
jgi:predicted regulator of Ras-like GTPase activity (Roadblock/LC7/MglB family)